MKEGREAHGANARVCNRTRKNPRWRRCAAEPPVDEESTRLWQLSDWEMYLTQFTHPQLDQLVSDFELVFSIYDTKEAYEKFMRETYGGPNIERPASRSREDKALLRKLLSSKERHVLFRVYVHRESYRSISRRLRISLRQVWKIEARALEALERGFGRKKTS